MTSNPLHSVSVAGVVFDDAKRVLLIKRRDNGQWQAPGGVLELGESFEHGVAREVREETGLEVEAQYLTGVYKNLAKGVVALVYRCRVLAGSPRPTSESAEVRWVGLDEFEELMTPAFAVRVADAIHVPGSFAPASRSHDGVNLV